MSRLLSILVVAGAVGVAAPNATAGGPTGITTSAETCKMTRQECARKAVDAMGTKAQFPFAETTADGNAQGWDTRSAVLVISFPTPDPERVLVVVAAAGDGKDNVSLCETIKTHIVSGTTSPKAPTRVVPDDGKAPPSPFRMCWKSEERPATNVLKYFQPIASLCLEKKGDTTNQTGGWVIGGGPDGLKAIFLAPTANAQSFHLCVIFAAPNDEPIENRAADLLGRIVKMLYE